MSTATTLVNLVASVAILIMKLKTPTVTTGIIMYEAAEAAITVVRLAAAIIAMMVHMSAATTPLKALHVKADKLTIHSTQLLHKAQLTHNPFQ